MGKGAEKGAIVQAVTVTETIAEDNEPANDTPPGFAESLARLRAPLYTRALILTKDHDAADDLVQRVCEKALVARSRFHKGTNLYAWLSRIMQNMFIDGYRARARWVPLCGDVPATQEPQEAHEEAPSLLGLLSFEDVVQAMKGLDWEDRRILELAHLQRRSYREIAIDLGLRPNTAGTRLFRARTRLRRRLESLHAARLDLGAQSSAVRTTVRLAG